MLLQEHKPSSPCSICFLTHSSSVLQSLYIIRLYYLIPYLFILPFFLSHAVCSQKSTSGISLYTSTSLLLSYCSSQSSCDLLNPTFSGCLQLWHIWCMPCWLWSTSLCWSKCKSKNEIEDFWHSRFTPTWLLVQSVTVLPNHNNYINVRELVLYLNSAEATFYCIVQSQFTNFVHSLPFSVCLLV